MKKDKEDWMNKKWRPAMGWMYMTVCIFDFILFPVGFTIVQFWETEASNDAFRQWEPLTLTGAGLFHMAMGAVLGITAWSRGQEKINGVAGGTTVVTHSQPASLNSTPTGMSSGVMGAGNFNTAPLPPIGDGNIVTVGYKGKKAPVEPQYPEI